ncbi:MAG: hypothetical protein WCF04_10890 [Candidatus Nanopelagicales bacterium]
MASRALYAGIGLGSHLALPHIGYPAMLSRCGWQVEHLSEEDAPTARLADYDLIIWNGTIPESALRAVSASQTLIAMNGAGGDCRHYVRYGDRIALATTSFSYSDDPPFPIRRPFGVADMVSKQYVLELITRAGHRYSTYGSPQFWAKVGAPLMYLPFAADPERFRPSGAPKDLRWCFVGQLARRPLVAQLAEISDRRGWRYELYGPEVNRRIAPTQLHGLYDRCEIGFNTQNVLHFGRELNERSFDMGMVGLTQVSDMGWLGRGDLDPTVRFYSESIASASDIETVVAMVAEPPADEDRAAVHDFYRRRHSFAARIVQISNVLGQDLTLGNLADAGDYLMLPGQTRPRE